MDVLRRHPRGLALALAIIAAGVLAGLLARAMRAEGEAPLAPIAARFEVEQPARELLAARAADNRYLGGMTGVRRGALAHGTRQARALAAAPRTIPGTTGTWFDTAKTPLLFNGPGLDNGGSRGSGYGEVSGRGMALVIDPRDPSGNTMYQGNAHAGVWKTTDAGTTWTEANGDIQNHIIGSLAFTPSGDALFACTGDPSHDGNSFAGLGIFRTRDGGVHWEKVSPPALDDTICGKIAVDPSKPERVYAATGRGLWMSKDGGSTWQDAKVCPSVKGPFDCVASDVAVRGKADGPNPALSAAPGSVLVAIGWRGGAKGPNGDQATGLSNGLYRSPTGEPGSFVNLAAGAAAAPGFATTTQMGKTKFSVAHGQGQDPDIVWAIVQDRVKFETKLATGACELADGDPTGLGIGCTVASNTVIEGVYSSTDFGQSWQRRIDPAEFVAAKGSAMPVYTALGVAPGAFGWYSFSIDLDPTRTDPATGAPTRVIIGFEEVYSIELAPPAGPITSGQIQTIGRYTNALGPECLATSTCKTTTHPDQHFAMVVPKGGKAVLYILSDGGVYRQEAADTTSRPECAAAPCFTNDNWGLGANRGLPTLIAFGAAMSRDGTTYIGLQDNGTSVVENTGRVVAFGGGDGSIVAVDPEKGKVGYGESQGGAMYVTLDGGKSSQNLAPPLTAPPFATPFKMDPLDSKHLLVGAQNIVDTRKGSGAAAAADWTQLFDLGKNPDNGPYQASQVELIGNAMYAGFCGQCDPVKDNGTFRNGIATDVQPNGTADPKKWEKIVTPPGLPARMITGIAIDPAKPSTVWVTLAGYGRRWAPVTGANTGDGHVFRSDDAGRTWTNVSGNLPDIPANDVVIRDGRLIVGTYAGVYSSTNLYGGKYEPLGNNLPLSPVYDLSFNPQRDRLVAGLAGRGAWYYDYNTVTPITAPTGPGADQPGTKPPTKPGTKAGQGTFQPLRLNFSRPGGAARRYNRGKRGRGVLVINARARAGTVRAVRGFLYEQKGRKRILIGRSARAVTIRKKGVVRIAANRRLHRGTYVLVLEGRNPNGRRGRATARLRFK